MHFYSLPRIGMEIDNKMVISIFLVISVNRRTLKPACGVTFPAQGTSSYCPNHYDGTVCIYTAQGLKWH